ncbi:MAG: NADH-quinone oxidoreductase subunit D [Nitrospinae bacterium]|nr:NADH-quinone oxidoreductase subunit D [Nitrospinota bacterium]MCH7649876.1 NADH-quinone oxidoreductase subunit D [Nitrospinota bacterium]MCH8932219.1 NADH-quinone oxidoreductase subunit D [Nitrospinota bacterium]MCZ6541469.1 NADH dehydrogenase (quinone) subunit D [Nitrospinota bacterium]TDJ52673.1 MAG: NADH-quinone oxidoreductase subunit D [Nitrospina sp.]
MSDLKEALHAEHMVLNMGPSHPATHGTVKFVLTLDGETIVDCYIEVGYLHRGFEKMCESVTWTNVFPYTDRLNYCSAIMNNVGFALAVEKLLGIECTDRCQYIRVVTNELSRISDHYTNIAAAALELGALTAFIYFVEAREIIWDFLEKVCGARLTSTYIRIGGLMCDLPPGFDKELQAVYPKLDGLFDDVDKLLTKNRIFLDRMRDTGGISKESAISFGFTGPCLRACGIDYDVRKAQPYMLYDHFDFDIPLGTVGDNFDRYLVRMEEIKQSFKIIKQALKEMPDGPINVDNPYMRQPSKQDAYSKMEEMIAHFKMTIDGLKPPVGEVYMATEAANGELGFYLVSDGSGKPYKCRVRPPCFTMTAAVEEIVRGAMLADIIPTFDMINMIGGECDR